MKFRLKVHKMRCNDCDFIFLVENDGQWERENDGSVVFDCPNCNLESEHLGDITVVEE